MTFHDKGSVSKANTTYDNPFQNYVEQPRLRDARIASAKQRDIEESHAAKKEREIIERYLKGYFNDDTLRLSALQIMGKLVFFLIVMPPLFVVFTIPKWLYLQIVEKGETLVDNVEKKLAAIATPIITWAISEWNRMGEMLGMRGKQIAELFTKGGQFFSKLVERTLSRLQSQVKEAATNLKGQAQPILSFLRNMGEKAAHPFVDLYSDLAALYAKLKPLVTQEKSSLPVEDKPSLVEGAKEWLKDIGEKLARLPSILREDGKEILEGAKKIAEISTAAVYNAAQIVTGLVVPFVSSFTSPLVAASKEKMNLAASVIKSLVHSAQMHINRFQGFLVLKYQETANLFANLFRPMMERGKQFGAHLLKMAFIPLKRSLDEMRKALSSFRSAMEERVAKGLKAIKDRLKDKRDRYMAQLSALKDKSRQRVRYFMEAIAAKRRGFLEYFVNLGKNTLFFLTQVLFAFSALFLIFKVFLKVAFRQAVLLTKKI